MALAIERDFMGKMVATVEIPSLVAKSMAAPSIQMGIAKDKNHQAFYFGVANYLTKEKGLCDLPETSFCNIINLFAHHACFKPCDFQMFYLTSYLAI